MKGWVGLLARLVVGGVWIYAGAIKLPDPGASVAAVRAYQLLPGTSAVTVGHLLPIVEVVLGVLLVLGVFVRIAGVVSSLLFVAFVIGIASVWARGLSIDCGCFGGGGFDPDAESKYPWEIARDVVLLGLSGYLVWLKSSPLSLDRVLFRTSPVDDLQYDDPDVSDEYDDPDDPHPTSSTDAPSEGRR